MDGILQGQRQVAPAGAGDDARAKQQAARDLAGVLLRVTQRKQVATLEALRWHSKSALIAKLLRVRKSGTSGVVPLVQRCKQATRELKEQIANCQKAWQGASGSDAEPATESTATSAAAAATPAIAVAGAENGNTAAPQQTLGTSTGSASAGTNGATLASGSNRPVVPPLGATGLLESLTALASNGHLRGLGGDGAPMISPAHPGPLRAARGGGSTSQANAGNKAGRSGDAQSGSQAPRGLAATTSEQPAQATGGSQETTQLSLAGSQDDLLWHELGVLTNRLSEENPKWARLFADVTRALEASHKSCKAELDAALQAQPERRQRRSRAQGPATEEEEVIFVGCSGQAPSALTAPKEAPSLNGAAGKATLTAASPQLAAAGKKSEPPEEANSKEAKAPGDAQTAAEPNAAKVIRPGLIGPHAGLNSAEKLATAAIGGPQRRTLQEPNTSQRYQQQQQQQQQQQLTALAPQIALAQPQKAWQGLTAPQLLQTANNAAVTERVSPIRPAGCAGQQAPKRSPVQVPSVKISLVADLAAQKAAALPNSGVDYHLGLGDAESQSSGSSFSDDEGQSPIEVSGQGLQAPQTGGPGFVSRGSVQATGNMTGPMATQGQNSLSTLGPGASSGGRMIGWTSVPDGLGRLAGLEQRSSASTRGASLGPAENSAGLCMGAAMPRRQAEAKVVSGSGSSGPIQAPGGSSAKWPGSALYVPGALASQTLPAPRSNTGLKEEDRGDRGEASFDSSICSSSAATSAIPGLFNLNTPRQHTASATSSRALAGGFPPSATAAARTARSGIVGDSRGSLGYRSSAIGRSQAGTAAPGQPSSAPPTPRQFLNLTGAAAQPQTPQVSRQVASGQASAAPTTLTSPRQVSVERAAAGEIRPDRRSPTIAGPQRSMTGGGTRISASASATRSPACVSSASGAPGQRTMAVGPSLAPATGQVGQCAPPQRQREVAPAAVATNNTQLWTPRTQHPTGPRTEPKPRGGAACRERDHSQDVPMHPQASSGGAAAMSLSPRSYTNLSLGTHAAGPQGASTSAFAPKPAAGWHTRR